MRILHAIHDFLPRHRAGSEIYACELAREQRERHDVFVLAAEYDPPPQRTAPSAGVSMQASRSRAGQQLGVSAFRRDATRRNASTPSCVTCSMPRPPDVLHVHNLLNLSFDLPRIAKARGIAIVATLHDYTLVCASGGQRVHVAEAHVCDTIDAERCARCFGESTLRDRWRRVVLRAVRRACVGPGRTPRSPPRAETCGSAGRRLGGHAVESGDIRRRLAYARHVLDTIDLFVAPSASIGEEFVRLGAPPDRVHVSDYGFLPMPAQPRRRRSAHEPLRIGFVGTLVWHKGVHVLIDARARTHGIL